MTVKPDKDEQADECPLRTIPHTLPRVLCRFPARKPGSVRFLPPWAIRRAVSLQREW